MTALVPVIGYEPAAAIAKEALKTGGSAYELVMEKGLLSKEQLAEMLRPENMTDPREIPKKWQDGNAKLFYCSVLITDKKIYVIL